MDKPSCACCSFVGFLPWGEDDEVNEKDDNSGKEISLSIDDIIISPNEAWERISAMGAEDTDEAKQQQILLVDTHGHPHLKRDIQYADATTSADESTCSSDLGVVSLTCAVSPTDWNDALEYASKSPQILPALGVHPWYLGNIIVEENTDICEDIEDYVNWDWLADLEMHLSEHPRLLVGEIGLCKMARFVREWPKERGGKATALQLQKLVFRKQLELAAKWSRPVTVHCVNAHGIFLEVMRDLLKEGRRAFPPAIGMHSFTGTAHHVSEILAFEKELLYPEEVLSGGKRRRKKREQQDIIENSDGNKDDQKDILFYFGFSHSVNHLMCTSEKARKKGYEAVRAVPSDRLLAESDVHASADVALGTAGAVAYVAQVRGENLHHVAQQTTRNGLKFLSSLGSLIE